MANTVSNPYKYSNRTAIDGKPLEAGKVLVPWWIQDGYEFKPSEKKHCTIIRFGEFKFTVGFIQINIECYETYMKGFNTEINNYMKERREGRCIIGYKENGEPICCPKSNHCKGCENRYNPKAKRYNPFKNRFDILSLDYYYDEDDEDSMIEVSYENDITPEEAYIQSEELSEEAYYALVLAHFEKKNPQYAEIIKLSKQKVSIEEICDTIGLKPSRGREEINNAYNALCDFLELSAYKLKSKHKK